VFTIFCFGACVVGNTSSAKIVTTSMITIVISTTSGMMFWVELVHDNWINLPAARALKIVSNIWILDNSVITNLKREDGEIGICLNN
jgi:hypothetical protein